jgi:hypothetical protein
MSSIIEIYGVHVNPKEDNLIKVLVERILLYLLCVVSIWRDGSE